MEINIRPVYIIIGIIVALVLFFGGMLVSANNTAIGYDEAIKNSKSGIQVQEQREYDLVTKLVQVVEQYSQFESDTQIAVTKARADLNSGDIANAALAINAVAEAYPDLKASAAYVQLMTELSVSENLKAQFRLTYNDQVQNYNRFVRRFPNTLLLRWTGYEVVHYDYLEADNTDLPEQLFQK